MLFLALKYFFHNTNVYSLINIHIPVTYGKDPLEEGAVPAVFASDLFLYTSPLLS